MYCNEIYFQDSNKMIFMHSHLELICMGQYLTCVAFVAVESLIPLRVTHLSMPLNLTLRYRYRCGNVIFVLKLHTANAIQTATHKSSEK